jgi:hypothetical protein
MPWRCLHELPCANAWLLFWCVARGMECLINCANYCTWLLRAACSATATLIHRNWDLRGMNLKLTFQVITWMVGQIQEVSRYMMLVTSSRLFYLSYQVQVNFDLRWSTRRKVQMVPEMRYYHNSLGSSQRSLSWFDKIIQWACCDKQTFWARKWLGKQRTRLAMARTIIIAVFSCFKISVEMLDWKLFIIRCLLDSSMSDYPSQMCEGFWSSRWGIYFLLPAYCFSDIIIYGDWRCVSTFEKLLPFLRFANCNGQKLPRRRS